MSSDAPSNESNRVAESGEKGTGTIAGNPERTLLLYSAVSLVAAGVISLAFAVFHVFDEAPDRWGAIGSILQGTAGTSVAFAGALVAIRLAKQALATSERQEAMQQHQYSREQTGLAVDFLVSAACPFGQLNRFLFEGDSLRDLNLRTYEMAKNPGSEFKPQDVLEARREVCERLRHIEYFLEKFSERMEAIVSRGETAYFINLQSGKVAKRVEELVNRVTAESDVNILGEFARHKDRPAAIWMSAPRKLRLAADRCREGRKQLEKVMQEGTGDFALPELDAAAHFTGFGFAAVAAFIYLPESVKVRGEDRLFGRGRIFLSLILSLVPSEEDMVEHTLAHYRQSADPRAEGLLDRPRLVAAAQEQLADFNGSYFRVINSGYGTMWQLAFSRSPAGD